jgi:hypothetical protein
MAQISYRTAFILDGDSLSTPEGWQVASLPFYDFVPNSGNLKWTYIVVGPGDKVNGVEDNQWEKIGDRTDLAWQEPIHLGFGKEPGSTEEDSPWWLIPTTLPEMVYSASPNLVCSVSPGTETRIPLTGPLSLEPGKPLLLDVETLAVCYPQFTFSSKENDNTINILYCETLSKDGVKGNRRETVGKEVLGFGDQVIMQPGTYTFEPLWMRTIRYIQITATKQATLEGLILREANYPLKVEASYRDDQPDTQLLWDTAIRTLHRCMGETFLDCPYYEQLMYVADTRVESNLVNYLTRDHRLPHLAVEMYLWSRLANGLTQSRFPSREVQVISTFSLWWILMLHDQTMSSDFVVRREHLELSDSIIATWKNDLIPNPERGHWTFGDWVPKWPWGEPKGRARSVQHLLLLAWAEVVLAKLKGTPLPTEVLASFQKPGPWMVTHQLDPDPEPTEHAEILWHCLHRELGIAPGPWPGDLPPGLPHSSLYHSYLKHRVANDRDFADHLSRWRDLLDLGCTTFPESEDPSRSECHGWSSHIALGYFEQVAGITPAEPGFKRARIEPRPGKREWFEAVVPLRQGLLKVTWQKPTLTIESPVPYDLIWNGETSHWAEGLRLFVRSE